MTAGELILILEASIAEHGDLEIFRLDDGGVADITTVEFTEKYSLPPVFLLS